MEDQLIVTKESDVQDLRDAILDLQDALDDLEAALSRVLEDTLKPEDFTRAMGQVFAQLSDRTDVQDIGQGSLLSRRYRVGRSGAYSYADVAWEEMENDTFTLDEAWDRLEPMMVSAEEGGKVYRSSLNRALKRDDRFRAFRSDGTIHFEKVPPDDEGDDE